MIVALIAAALAIQSMPAEPQPTLAPGTVTISSVSGDTLSNQALGAFDDAVQRALSASNFTLLSQQGHGRYAARVVVTRRSRGVVASKQSSGGPPRASLNGGMSVSLGAGSDTLNDLVVTELTITLVQRSNAKEVWTGSAVTARVSGTSADAVGVIAPLLANAVMAQFPGKASGPVSIP